MVERKLKGPKNGDIQVIEEARQLDGLSWTMWKPTLDNKLKQLQLQPLNGDSQETIHGWFVLRHLRKLDKINEEQYETRKRLLFEGKNDDFFDNPTITNSIKLITEKTEKLTQR